MKKLMTGNEALVQGAWEAGVLFASAYPGTPSTEILENMSLREEVVSEWAPNEKVALEAAIGASIAGVRSMASMKHVGVNVAADALFTYVYTGVNGGLVLISADEPGQHSSQNEQDNRNYAKFAKMPMLEPTTSQESLDMMKAAFEISEEYDTPVLVRMTTRSCHSKGIVEIGDRVEVEPKPYVKNVKKYVTVPANARGLRANLEVRMGKLAEASEKSPFNYVENPGKKIGVISSGMAYTFAQEVFGDQVSYLKLGFSYPHPLDMMKKFCQGLETIYIIEENDPIIEEAVKLLGFECHGKDTFPAYGELTPDVIRKAVTGEEKEILPLECGSVVDRPPTLCGGFCSCSGCRGTLHRHQQSGDLQGERDSERNAQPFRQLIGLADSVVVSYPGSQRQSTGFYRSQVNAVAVHGQGAAPNHLRLAITIDGFKFNGYRLFWHLVPPLGVRGHSPHDSRDGCRHAAGHS